MAYHITTTPGSGTLKFYASMRVEFKKVDRIKGKVLNKFTGEMEDGILGQVVEAKIVKNKMAPPFSTCRFVVSFGVGVSAVMTACYLAIEKSIIEKLAVGYYKLPVAKDCDMEKVRGVSAVHDYYRNSMSALDYLCKLVYGEDVEKLVVEQNELNTTGIVVD